MQRILMKSKIHRATVTRADLDYEGSCSLGPELMHAAGLVAGEQVHIVNISNGSRAVTYAMEGEPGEVGLNGAMSQLGAPGDLVILIAYAQVGEDEVSAFRALTVFVDADNRIREKAAVN